ncbi:hypothetical protein SLI_8078 [Streptomyces lividans 1326]|uniref:Uncharacterized protein n=1 Tax=Streptomyces lividans 1326 TaxID=1200984 RepID=A0A7U9E3P3_STRLI|nr:hypothetical protein SLI_8078 [Streptomyces lividans 1326]
MFSPPPTTGAHRPDLSRHTTGILTIAKLSTFIRTWLST